MTLENCKRLYAHYVFTENKEAAEDMLKNRPELAQIEEEKEKKAKK